MTIIELHIRKESIGTKSYFWMLTYARPDSTLCKTQGYADSAPMALVDVMQRFEQAVRESIEPSHGNN